MDSVLFIMRCACFGNHLTLVVFPDATSSEAQPQSHTTSTGDISASLADSMSSNAVRTSVTTTRMYIEYPTCTSLWPGWRIFFCSEHLTILLARALLLNRHLLTLVKLLLGGRKDLLLCGITLGRGGDDDTAILTQGPVSLVMLLCTQLPSDQTLYLEPRTCTLK